MSSRRKRRAVKSVTPVRAELTGVAKLLSEMPIAELDLHGFSRAQARLRVRDFIMTYSRISSGGVVHIVTGRGKHSGGDAVLKSLVQDMLHDDVADLVQEQAGLHGGGGWVVRLR